MERAKSPRRGYRPPHQGIARPNPSANLCVAGLYQLPGHCAGAQCRSTAASPYHPRHNRRSRLSGRSGCAENTSRTVRLRQWEATSCGTRFFRRTPEKLEDTFGSLPQENAAPVLREFDVLVLGGGPAGASAAVYSARKGLRVAIIAERIGGQVKKP